MVIIKRNGTEVVFDKTKIYNAIMGAVNDIASIHPTRNAPELAGTITDRLVSRYRKRNRALAVEEIQDDVETELMKEGAFEVAKAYIRYRHQHELLRNSSTLDGKILSLVDGNNEEVIQENSNKNPVVNSTQRDYMAGELSRDITDRLLLPKEIAEAHKEGIIHFHDTDYYAQRMHNCFSSKTRFITKEGVVAFSDCYDGQNVVVLDKDGNWRDATVHKYGKQKLYDITLRSCRSKKTVVCTRDHRWILHDGTVTTSLSIGDTLYALKDSTTKEIMSARGSEMFSLGFVIGDGCDVKGGLRVRLCGEKAKYSEIFQELGYRKYIIDKKDPVYTKRCDISKQEFLDHSIWRYLNGYDKKMLFKGLYAADGNSSRNQISTSDKRVLTMIQEISAIAGYHVASVKTIKHDTNFKKDATLYSVSFRIKQNQNNLWKVEKIEPHRCDSREQDVWCVEEPTTHSFTLDGGIVTGNCDLVNLEDMLQNGTVISGTLIEKPHSFSTACNIASQIIAQVASNQYGGQSISLAHLAPFVDVSRQKIRKRVEAEQKMAFEKVNGGRLESFSGAMREAIEEITEQRVKEEINKGVQTIQYQVNTLLTTNGQAPFITVYMYLGEVEDGQLKKDLAMVIEETVRQRIEGVKNERGVWITPAFPKLIYVLEEDNIHEDSPYFYLTKLCAQCSAKRLVPDYISEKKMLELKGDVYTCMGCRSFLTPDRFTDAGIGNIANAKNYEPGKHKYYGRFNQGVVTINLPDVGLSARKAMIDEHTTYVDEKQWDSVMRDKFWAIFDERLELCHRALRLRHERLRGTVSDAAPILWQYGALARLQKGEVIDRLLYDGYSTISLGYAGLYECVKAITGKSHTDPEIGRPFALEIMQYMNDKCQKWREAENIDYSIYGTPIESTTYKFAKCLQKRFGVIDGITDKGYITNSYHVHVTEPIDAFSKLKFEADFQHLSPGGAISYIETSNLQHNVEAVISVMRFIYDNIIYAELNTKSDYCQVCGWDGEISIVYDENDKLIWQCPKCGSTDKNKMNVARRTCGYIGTNDWNQGRTQEIKERYVHL